MENTPTDKHKWCNHHHELTDEYEIVDFGDGKFVANKAAIPLLKALNEAGIKTRTHHYDGGNEGFISILLDNVTLEVKQVFEAAADRTKFNGKTEVLICWDKSKLKSSDPVSPSKESVLECAKKDPLI